MSDKSTHKTDEEKEVMINIMTRPIQKSDLKANTRGVLHIFYFSMIADGERFPSIKQQAKYASLSERILRKHLALAVEARFLEKTEHGYTSTMPIDDSFFTKGE